MDLYCSRCGEPWDIDYVNFEMESLERVDFKAGKGCQSCKGMEKCKLPTKCSDCQDYSFVESNCRLNKFKRPLRAEAAGVLHDILGDDLDGIAAELEDFGF